LLDNTIRQKYDLPARSDANIAREAIKACSDMTGKAQENSNALAKLLVETVAN